MLTLDDWLVLALLLLLFAAPWGVLGLGFRQSRAQIESLQRTLDVIQAETIRSQLFHNAHANALAGLLQSLDQAGLLRGPQEG